MHVTVVVGLVIRVAVMIARKAGSTKMMWDVWVSTGHCVSKLYC